MRIVILRTNTADFGKIGTYNVQEVGLANALKKKGHKTYVLYLNKKVDKIDQDETYDFVYYLPHKTFGLHGIFDVKLLNEFNPNLIIFFSDNQLWAKNVILWCKKNDVKCIHYFGNVLSDNPKWSHQFYTKLILKRNIGSYKYSINVAKTEKVHQEMRVCKVPFTKVIPVGLDDTVLQDKVNMDFEIREELGLLEDEIVLLFIGRLIDYKKPLLACDILLKMLDTGIKTRLIMIGIGEMRNQLLNYIKEKNIENYVIYVERVPYQEMYKYMVASDCFINLSDKEIFGMAILESMYYRLPVVAHVAPGPNEILENGISGLLLNSYDTDKWVTAINEAIKNRNKLGDQSRIRITKKYFWDRIANEFIDLVKDDSMA